LKEIENLKLNFSEIDSELQSMTSANKNLTKDLSVQKVQNEDLEDEIQLLKNKNKIERS